MPAAVALTCSHDAPTTPPGVARVELTPSSSTGSIGQSVQFAATVYDAAGRPMTDQVVRWSTTSDAVATVSPAGEAVGRGPGIAWVFAVAGGEVASAELSVTDSAAGGGGAGDGGTSESVTPPTAALAIGATQQLTAVVRNLLGVIIGDIATTWSTSDASVASVSPGGVVTAIAPGVATITANTLGLTATSAVTVVGGGPVPSRWPHAPPTYPVLADEAFDYLTPPGWQLTLRTAGMVTSGLDASAPASPPSVLQFTYPAGFPGGRAPGTEHHGLASARQFYAGWWWKTNAEWQGHNSNVNKLAFLYLDGDGGDTPLVFYGPPGGPYELRVALQFRRGDGRFWLTPNIAHVPVTMGEWHRTEWQVEYNTTTAPANGIIRWWLDGTLVGEYTDVLFPPQSIVEFQISPTFGGIGDIKAATDRLLVDDLYLSGR